MTLHDLAAFPGHPARRVSRAGVGFGTLAGLLALAALSVAGCGDEKVVAVGGGPAPDASVDVGPASDVAEPDGGPGADTGEPQGLAREIILLHDTSEPIQVIITEDFLIRAKVIDYQLSAPAPNALVTLAIVTNDGGGDASLTTNQAYTDASGQVEVQFRAGLKPDVHYEVELTTLGADPVRLPLYVVDTPKGNIDVKLAYEGPIAIKNVHVRLFPGSYTCGQFKPINVPENPLGEKTVLGLGGTGGGSQEAVSFEDLPDSQKFTVVATAQSPTGSLAAAGCLDGVMVLAGQDNTVTLTMYLLVLNPAGIYDTTNIFDFTGAIPGQVGEMVDQIVLLFNDPGKFLIDQVKNLVANYVGQLVTDAVFGLFEDQLADIVTNWMLNQSPDWLQNVFVIGQDLTQVVNNLEMQATLIISKLSNDYYVQGVLNWTGIVLYWHYGCAKEGEPDYDPECGKYVFSMEQFSNTEFPMDIVSGKFTGLIHDFDQLDIDNHVIKINYGKLIIFVLNEMILPAISGENTLLDAILSFVDCGSIASSFSNSVLDGIGVSENDIEGFCTNAITLIVSPVELLLGNLALDSQLRLQGKARLVDDDNNLVVDHIVDGIYQGHIESGGEEGSSFDGVWSADRKEP